jgi:cysteine desulfurase
MDTIYLDHAATSPLCPEAREAMQPWLDQPAGNPSALHVQGRRARAAIDDARDRLAAASGCAAREVIFTSGGTEADNLALRGVLERWGPERGRHIVISAIEHEAVLATARRLEEIGAAEVTVVGCDAQGRVDPAAVAAAVRGHTLLVSVMLANNEVGTVQPVPEIAAAVRRRNPVTLIHTDAVQALGRLGLGRERLGADLISLSAHKAGGPVGTGALIARHGLFLAAQLTGGGQERGRRSGTENVAGICGFAAAAEVAERHRPSTSPRLAGLVGRLTRELRAARTGFQLTGDPVARLPGLLSGLLPGCRSDVLLVRLDAAGVLASAGSACASDAPEPSHVLRAMGVPAAAATCALRLSLGRATRDEEVDRAIPLIADAVAAIRAVTGTR